MIQRLPRLLIALTLIPFIVVGLPQPCLACACAEPTPAQALERADVVFRGRVTEFAKEPANRYKADGTVERVTIRRVTFSVDTSWKGRVTPEMSLFGGEVPWSSDCDFLFARGEEYIVYAYSGGSPRDLPPLPSTGLCSGTRPVKEAGAYLSALDAGTPVSTTSMPASPTPRPQSSPRATPTATSPATPVAGAVAKPPPSPVTGVSSRAVAPVIGMVALLLAAIVLMTRRPSGRKMALAGGVVGFVAGGLLSALILSPTRATPPAAPAGTPTRAATTDTVADDRTPTIFVEFGVQPIAIAVDGQGNVYVTDTQDQGYRDHHVLKYSPTGQLLEQWGGMKIYDRPGFLDPYGLAVDGQGNVYVADRSYPIQKLSPTGQPLPGWGGVRGPTQSNHPVGIAVDTEGNLYMVDGWEHRVEKFSPSAQPLAQWGSQGRGPGQFLRPQGIAIDAQGDIYVADTDNNRIQKLSPVGQPLAQWGGTRGDGPGEFKEPWGVAVDGQGNVYVADTGNDRIQQLSPTGQPVAEWGGIGSEPGQFRRPTGVAVDPQGNVYVADSWNFRIQKIPAAGR